MLKSVALEHGKIIARLLRRNTCAGDSDKWKQTHLCSQLKPKKNTRKQLHLYAKFNRSLSYTRATAPHCPGEVLNVVHCPKRLCESKVFCLEHNAVSLARLKTWLLCPEFKHTNHFGHFASYKKYILPAIAQLKTTHLFSSVEKFQLTACNSSQHQECFL